MANVTIAIIQDTFREAFARKIFWGVFALSTLMILFLLFLLKIDIVEGALATITIFGQPSRGRNDVEALVKGFHAGLATFLYTWGMFLAVFASSGLIPSVLEPGRIELLLSKPVTRTHILIGRYIGNLLVVALNIVYLVTSAWLIFAFKTGIWSPHFLITIISTIFVFAVLLTVVVLMGVLFDSAALATMVTVAVMIMSPILAQGRIVEKLLSSEWSRQIWRGLYYVLPKVYDLGKMTLDFVRGQPNNDWNAVFTSAAFGALMLSASAWWLSRRDF